MKCLQHLLFFALTFLALQQGPSRAEERDQVVHILSDSGMFSNIQMFLPGEGIALVDGISVEGMLVGFEGDFLPLVYGENELRLPPADADESYESFFVTFHVDSAGISVGEKRLRSASREIVSWEDPEILETKGKGTYNRIIIPEPVLRDVERGAVLPAMWGPTKILRLTLRSEPPGSEIYINNEKLDFLTPKRLSVPFMEGEDEKRFLIRQVGLVNCYGLVKLPQRDAEVSCLHRDVD